MSIDATQVITTSIGTAGVITVGLLGVKYRDKIIKKEEKPKDRIDIIFDGYESLIKQQKEEISAKAKQLEKQKDISNKRLGEALAEAQKVNEDTRKLLELTRKELADAKLQNDQLTKQLAVVRQDYSSHKVGEIAR